MLFDYGGVIAGQIVLIHGAAGNVGAYAVQLAKQAGLHVVATAASANVAEVGSCGSMSSGSRWWPVVRVNRRKIGELARD